MGRETNKGRRDDQARNAREKAAAARAQSRQQEQRRRAIVVLSSIVAIAVVAVVIVVIAINSKGSNKEVVGSASTINTVMSKVASVPAATLETVGMGGADSLPQAISGVPAASQPLTGANGHPQLFFIGGEFCPYCAAERWGIAVALSRFGTLSGTSFTQSSGTDVYPNTATLDFKNATFSSKYLNFAPIEAADRDEKPLQSVPTNFNKLWYAISAKYVPKGHPSFPFLDFGNKYAITSPTFSPEGLAGLTQLQIANQLADPNSAVAKDVDGSANVITATICDLTNNQPASVCSSGSITSIQKQLAAGAG